MKQILSRERICEKNCRALSVIFEECWGLQGGSLVMTTTLSCPNPEQLDKRERNVGTKISSLLLRKLILSSTLTPVPGMRQPSLRLAAKKKGKEDVDEDGCPLWSLKIRNGEEAPLPFMKVRRMGTFIFYFFI